MAEQQSPAEQRAVLAGIATIHELRLFKETLNPIHAWRAYQKTRTKNLPVPKWVLEYLDDVAEHLLAPEGAKDVQAIAHATALKPHGRKGPSAAWRATVDRQHLAVRDEIKRLRHTGRSLTDAIGDVAERTGLSSDTVKAIWEGRR